MMLIVVLLFSFVIFVGGNPLSEPGFQEAGPGSLVAVTGDGSQSVNEVHTEKQPER